MKDSLNTLLLIGSAREQRMADRVLKWLLPQFVTYPEFSIRTADARDFDGGRTERRAATRLLEADAAAADVVIVLTPEYNHSFPSTLKLMLDSLGEPWRRKPVAFISYGGTSLLTLMLCVGLLMNIHVHRDVHMGVRGGFNDF